MLKANRCCDRPMTANSESSYKYTSMENTKTMEYPEAMPMMMGHEMMGMGMGCMMPPVYECPQERVCHREFVHEVPHVVPINTRIINHHIYKHSYTPCYTSCEENVVSNVYDDCSYRF